MAIPLAGTPDPATTFTVDGATVSVLPSGDIVVTTTVSGGTTTTAYATGSEGWLRWTHDIDVASTDTDIWNARTAPRAVAATSPGSGSGSGAGTGAGAGTGTGAGAGASTAGVLGGSGAQIPATLPPIGIAVGSGIGMTTVDAGGTMRIGWLRGILLREEGRPQATPRRRPAGRYHRRGRYQRVWRLA